MQYTLIFSCLIAICLCDCPLVPYPRLTTLSSLTASLTSSSSSSTFIYTLSQPLQYGAVNVAIGIVGLQIQSNGIFNWNIQYIPTTETTQLQFKVSGGAGWREITFGFFATQSTLFEVGSQTVQQFSVGLEPGKYAVYRPIPNFNNVQNEPIIKVFISGINLIAKPLDASHTTLQNQYDSFRQFSTNTQLITYFFQALQTNKAIQFSIADVKTLGRLFSFNINTNGELTSLTFSYVIFSKTKINEKHNYIAQDFSLSNAQIKFSSLQNVDMLLTGLTGFKIPRDSFYEFGLSISHLLGQSYYNLITNVDYLDLAFSHLGFDMKLNFVCSDCPSSPIIYESQYCVETCPRSFSRSQSNDLQYCDKCDMDKLKVVDSDTNTCVCAKRHFLNSSQDLCKPCSYDCMTCSSADRCLTCDNALLQTKRKLSSLGKCQCPSVEYYDDKATENIVCQKCDPGCLTCNGPTAHDCLTCLPTKQRNSQGFCVCRNGFVLDASRNCVCPPPRTLNSQNICLDTSTSACGANKIEQFIDVTKRCVCKTGFISVLDECISCSRNAVFNNQTLKCECSKPTVDINGTCQSCATNEVFDDILKICVCAGGAFKNSKSLCVKCTTKMALFEDECECIFNYYESSPGVCKRCIRETDGPKCKRNLS